MQNSYDELKKKKNIKKKKRIEGKNKCILNVKYVWFYLFKIKFIQKNGE